MAFPASYPIKPIHPSPVGSWTNGNLNVTRQFLVPCENIEEFIEDMLTTTGSACGLPSTFPGWPLVFVDSINWEPLAACCMSTPGMAGVLTNPTTELEGYPSQQTGSDEGEICWCKITVRYATKEVLAGQDGVREGTWVSYERNMSGEIQALPNRNLYWEGTGKAVRHDTQVPKFIPLADIVLDWHFISEEDMCFTETNLLEMQGCVNENTYGGFLFPGTCADIWAPETLMFLGYSTHLDIGAKSVFGTYCTAVEKHRSLRLQFRMKRLFGFDAVSGGAQVVGWNHRYYDGNESPPGWYRVVSDLGAPVHDVVAFANIFL